MTILKHEIRQGRLAFLVWTVSIAFMLVICMLVYPEMESGMKAVTSLFASMGSFTAAFGMDRLNFGEVMGFYGVECGNILSLGGGLFSALLGITALSKEEKEGTAEFLLSHPIRRSSVVLQKLGAIILHILLMNLIVMGAALAAFAMIRESPATKEFLLLHTAYALLQVEIACICFGISAFLHSSGMGISMGLAIVLYFLNLVKNISDKAGILKYITPFAYAEAADIVSEGQVDIGLVLLGGLYSVVCVGIGFAKYVRKDIAA